MNLLGNMVYIYLTYVNIYLIINSQQIVIYNYITIFKSILYNLTKRYNHSTKMHRHGLKWRIKEQ
jgi:hypothetical protein